MGVGIQRKGCCMMTQIFLDCFYIVPRFETVHGKCVTEIMEADMLQSGVLQDLLM